MDYVYGPIPSRRLGKSLGIDPIPLKTCNWNCIYCQLGRSTPLTNEPNASHEFHKHPKHLKLASDGLMPHWDKAQLQRGLRLPGEFRCAGT